MNFSTLNFQNFVSVVVLTSSGLLAACGGGGGGGSTPNTDPVVQITSTSACSPCNVGQTVSIQATATDAEDGDLTSSISWSSNKQDFEPALPQGGSLSVSTLQVATHTITAEVTDSSGKRVFVNTVIQIINDRPEISANVADNRTEVIVDESVTLVAIVSDTEDDERGLDLVVVWDSINLGVDGSETVNLGTGASLVVEFDEAFDIGQKTIRATVTDSNGAEATAPVFEIDVLPLPGSVYIKASNTEGLGSSCRFGAIIDDNETPADGSDDVLGNGCDNFGFAVALSKDGLTLAVGAPFDDGGEDGIDNSLEDSGAVHVYRDNGTTWVLEGYLRAPDASEVVRFGSALALNDDGTVLAVTVSGAAYIYLKDGSDWSVGARVDTFDKRLPASIALNSAGDVLAVGSPREEKVFLYTLAADVASPRLELIASNPDADDRFGIAVALDAAGDTLIVGASQESSGSVSEADNSAGGAGAAYIFVSTADVWSQTKYLKAVNILPDDLPNLQANSGFGTAVAINSDGTRVAIGAPQENIDGDEPDSPCRATRTCTGDEGAAYVFSASGVDWVLASRAVAQNRGAGDDFGRSVALTANGLRLFVGARAEDSKGKNIGGTQTDDFYSNAENDDPPSFYNEANSGAVYEFNVSSLAGSQQTYYKAFNSAEGDKFGRSIAISADGLVKAFGANLEDGSGQGVDADLDNIEGLQTGAVYLFK